MGWTRCLAADLVVGDAVLLTRTVKVEEDGRWRRCKLRHTARVIHTYDRDPYDTYDASVLLETVDVIPPIDETCPPQRGCCILSFETLDLKGTALRRHTEHGPTVRLFRDGREYLLGLLKAAAGGDETNPDAVQAVASCVHRGEIDLAREAGRLPNALGTENAIKMLTARIFTSEAIIRQLTGQMPRVEVSGSADSLRSREV